MSIRLAKPQRLALGLTLAVVGLLSACVQSPPSHQIVLLPAPTQAVPPTTTRGLVAITRTLEGKVVGVADGDTITILNTENRQTRVRLQGIDAPESRQAFGQDSKRNLSDLIFNRQVVIEYEKTDKYGRTLGKVLVDGRDVNLEQIKAGLAWHYRYYQDEQVLDDRRLYADAETEARSAGRGLWAAPNPIPPWDFRRGKRGKAEVEGLVISTGVPAPASTSATRRQTEGQTVRTSEPEGETVYVTRTGSKYHRLSCQYLRRSRVSVSLKEARQSFEPCSVCRPPQ